MTTPISNIDNTTLLALTPNLDIGDIADPALRLAYFQYLNVYIQTITAAFNAFVANGAVGTVNLADLSVTTAKIALLAITAAQLADGSVTSAKILDGTILNTDINASAAIAWSKISKSSSSLADLATRLITDLTGVLAAAQFPILTGDVTTAGGSLTTALKNTGTAATYKSVTTDPQGRVISGTNPTTLVGFGITDAAPLTHVGSSGSSQHAVATSLVDGFMSAIAYNYLYGLTPSGLGSFAVPNDIYITFGSRFKIGYNSTTDTLDTYET